MIHTDAIEAFPEPEFIEGGPPTADDCTRAMLAHLGGFFTGFVLPGIVMFTQRDRSPFVVRHARESVNHQIMRVILVFLSTVLAAGASALFYAAGAHAAFVPLPGLAVLILLLLLLGVIQLFLVIRACMSAAKGQEFRYPLTIRLI